MPISSNHRAGELGKRPVRLDYSGRGIDTFVGARLLDAILDAGIEHRHLCGGRAFCTSCRVEVMDGRDNLSAICSLERERLGADAGRLRLACQARILGKVAVRVPPPAPVRFDPFAEE